MGGDKNNSCVTVYCVCVETSQTFIPVGLMLLFSFWDGAKLYLPCCLGDCLCHWPGTRKQRVAPNGTLLPERSAQENELDFAYWSINGRKRFNESETYGLLQDLALRKALRGWV